MFSSVIASLHRASFWSQSPKAETFDVLVLATMSAGKTAVINALIGEELLHSANEATTACMTSVEHQQGLRHFAGACYSYSDQELGHLPKACSVTLRDWNANSEVKRISLRGGFKTVPTPAPGLVLHDTPGPNNSQDCNHAELMLETLRTVPFNALCYVLNASQLGTQDDRALLEQLREECASLPARPIYFILNKIDLLDPERGETLEGVVERTGHYLSNIGFEEPVIVPTMANIALYARKALQDQNLTRAQRLKLSQALSDLGQDKRALLHAAAIPQIIRKRVARALTNLQRQRQLKAEDALACERNDLQQLITISGLKTLEALIKHQRQSLTTP